MMMMMMTEDATTTRMLRVHVVEDRDDDLFLIHEAARLSGSISVDHVSKDGPDALAYLRREPPYQRAARPDLVLLDINLPRMNGLEVLKEIKKEPRLRDVPVVMFTGSFGPNDITAAFAQGASSFLRKPTTFNGFQRLFEEFATYWSGVTLLPPR